VGSLANLPEPERGKQSWISARQSGGAQSGDAAQRVLEADVQPRQHLILRQNPTQRSLWWAIKHLVQLPTYDLLIIASTLAYFFFAGVRAFAMIYLTKHYGLSRSAVGGLAFVVGIDALAGFVVGGRLAESFLRKGYLNIRIALPAIGRDMRLGCRCRADRHGAAGHHSSPPGGRGEAGRAFLRTNFEGGAPLLFGAVSVWLGGGANGLMWTFLIMLLPMLVAGSPVLPGIRTYRRDDPTAAMSAEATAKRVT
jgi:hypothetical protein